MKLVDNWKQAWRWWSVRLAAIGAAIAGTLIVAPESILQAWALLPADMQASLEAYRGYIALAAFGLAIVARLVEQPKKGEK